MSHLRTRSVTPWLLSLLLAAAPVNGAGWHPKLPQNSDEVRDSNWLNELPEVVLPLPKPATLATPSPAAAPQPVVTPPPAAPQPVVAPSPAAPQPVVALPPVPPPVTPPPVPPPITAPSSEPPSIAQQPEPEPEAISPPQPVVSPPELAAVVEIEEVEVIDPEGIEPGGCAGENAIIRPECRPRYYWQMQLLAGRSLQKVRDDRDTFVRRHGDLLEGLALVIVQRPEPTPNRPGGLYRLRAKSMDNATDARLWCVRLKLRGEQCLVVRSMLVPRGASAR